MEHAARWTILSPQKLLMTLKKIEILHQFIFSHHRPVAATIITAPLSHGCLCDNISNHKKQMNWNRATQQQKLKY